ncbi:hypothetical protein MRB53_021947 [Persea americana]|uniref:Uncharacterized protein n=1 Tax=Persea americana TaxID=3435 RepID=A0ACC2L5D0_PERAE|nr:hypothetical protein MRB53_021947 [Persea americana]
MKAFKQQTTKNHLATNLECSIACLHFHRCRCRRAPYLSIEGEDEFCSLFRIIRCEGPFIRDRLLLLTLLDNSFPYKFDQLMKRIQH